jgi:hypothetical protein
VEALPRGFQEALRTITARTNDAVTLIAVYTSEGCIGRCDAKCYEAREPECTCVCSGANHGAGLAQATDNTRRYAEAWLEKYAGERNLTEYRHDLGQAVEQLSLW